MRIAFVLLSPTFGMHQYTADLANRMADEGIETFLVTTTTFVGDRYSPAVRVVTPITAGGTGFAPEGLRVGEMQRVQKAIQTIAPDVVHFTGVHAWNIALVRWLRRQGVPVVHTLHDLDPHQGVRFARLIRLWNRLITASADRLLVHGQLYARRLAAAGCQSDRITCTPLLHLFLSYKGFAALGKSEVHYGNWGLFFGRLESYKGVAQLIAAERMLASLWSEPRLIVAGQGTLDSAAPLPPTIEVRNHRIEDAEAVDLFRQCGVLVMPYLDGTQSALAAAAYFFAKPVIVTAVGALPEYVQPGVTGWVVPPGDVAALAGALDEALSDGEQLRRMGEAGRAWYEAQRRAEHRTLLEMYRGMGVRKPEGAQ